jgi:hypothetical protein
MPWRSVAMACQRIPRRQDRLVARPNRPSGMEVRLGPTCGDQCGRHARPRHRVLRGLRLASALKSAVWDDGRGKA